MATRRKRTTVRRAGSPGLLSPKRGRRWSAYFISGITLLVALAMALPFCTRPITG